MKKEVFFPPSSRKTEKVQVVAIGASAGGLEALKAFFSNLPAATGRAFVVIQHLSPDFKSMMGELLERVTKLPIVEVTEAMEPRPDHIYLIPPIYNLLYQDGKLQPTEKPKNHTLNLPIDLFFESLSRELKEDAIGVILSGTGSDGTRGSRAIKEKDGMIMVQDPKEAQFNGMPQSAIGTGLVDYVLSVKKMGEELSNFFTAQTVFHFKDGDVEQDRTELMKILSYVDKNMGLDFREYKRATLARRVARRVQVCKSPSLSEYLEYLKSNKEEVEILYREFLIGVTRFFRDPQVWEVLRNEVFPELVRKTPNGETLKLWNVACSTGEEPYSFAICLLEEIEKQKKTVGLKIFATDISKEHLAIAGNGFYPETIAADVPPELLVKYFHQKTGSYVVNEKVRNSVIFSMHNVIKNPPFSKMDLVSCRNLLIYFQPNIQKKALDFLHFSLKKEGILVLGTSESVTSHENYFEVVNRKWKIYRNVQPSKTINNTNIAMRQNTTINNSASVVSRKIPQRSAPVLNKLDTEFSSMLLEHFKGACVYIDSEYNILDAIGEFRKYANLPGQGFSINLLEMLDTELKHLVQISIRKAQKMQEKVYYKEAVFLHNDEKKSVDIIVKPFEQHNLRGETHYIVTFIEKEVDLEDAVPVDSITLTKRTQEYVMNLEEELRQAREDLQVSLQEIETSNEELQTANEELLASNEELQSTNEELQSVNEEINTVNAENLQKVEDLEILNADINNLLESTQLGTIFLDADLRIRKFTPAIREHFNLVDTDEGRSISDFLGQVGRNKLLQGCERVLETGEMQEKAVKTNGKSYLRRLSAFRNKRQKIEGVVITFIDITGLQRSKEQLEASEKRYRNFYEEDPIMHLNLDPRTAIIKGCNRMTVEKLGYTSKEELIGESIFDLFPEHLQMKALKDHKEFQKEGKLFDVEQEILTTTGSVIPVILNASAEKDEQDRVLSYRYTFADISDLKQIQEKLKKQKTDLEALNKDLEQFVSICSHDLQEPLATIKMSSDLLNKLYSEKLDEKGVHFVNYIRNGCQRMSNQIRALLEHSRIGRDGKLKNVDLKVLLDNLIRDMAKSMMDSGARIHYANLPVVKGYEVELRLLFQNLISNAIKYTPEERQPEVRINAYREGDYWIFSVIDNGNGIPKENLESIFTIFNRIGNETKDGTGVGLAHVQKIVKLHGGTIWVDSQLGVGSSFYFKLKA